MGYKTATYGLTGLGKLGAFLFVAPTPIAGFYASAFVPTADDLRRAALGLYVDPSAPSPTIFILLATATLVGAVMLLVGRELVSYEA